MAEKNDGIAEAALAHQPMQGGGIVGIDLPTRDAQSNGGMLPKNESKRLDKGVQVFLDIEIADDEKEILACVTGVGWREHRRDAVMDDDRRGVAQSRRRRRPGDIVGDGNCAPRSKQRQRRHRPQARPIEPLAETRLLRPDSESVLHDDDLVRQEQRSEIGRREDHVKADPPSQEWQDGLLPQ